jgi:hypothetical protein
VHAHEYKITRALPMKICLFGSKKVARAHCRIVGDPLLLLDGKRLFKHIVGDSLLVLDGKRLFKVLMGSRMTGHSMPYHCYETRCCFLMASACSRS